LQDLVTPYSERMAALPLPTHPLSDAVVTLRPWRREDVPIKAVWGRDEAIVRWTEIPANNTEEAALAWAVRAEEAREAGRAVALAIVDAKLDVLLGSCDIRRPDLDDSALGEVGFLLVKGARGRGIATRAVGLLVEWSFRELGMERIQGLVHPDNPPSARVLERVGFRREGLLRRCRVGEAGREDRILFSVLPDEFVLPAPPTEG
jgi:RimJ/RimL family protein N-acetyltransferase